MQTELLTLSKLFTECIYRIPDYQRGYSWVSDHLRDFWLDLELLAGDQRHYTGVLTLELVPQERWRLWQDDKWIIESRHYRPYHVVDGQQRLTTVIVLIQCILERAANNGIEQLNYTATADIRRKFVFDTKKEALARSYLFGYEKDNPSYEYLKQQVFME